jgi:hypothetical protein
LAERTRFPQAPPPAPTGPPSAGERRLQRAYLQSLVQRQDRYMAQREAALAAGEAAAAPWRSGLDGLAAVRARPPR